jgi:hypothetical protein
LDISISAQNIVGNLKMDLEAIQRFEALSLNPTPYKNLDEAFASLSLAAPGEDDASTCDSRKSSEEYISNVMARDFSIFN